jgi:hypothetical protein
MEKKDLIKLLDEIFLPLGFKKKGNNWIFNGIDINKVINLQKSNFGNSYYINFGYIIKRLELTTKTHVENRLASIDKNQQIRITDLLDLETIISDANRLEELREIIYDKVVLQIQSINNEIDLLNNLKNRNHLNNVPIVVKKYFNI